MLHTANGIDTIMNIPRYNKNIVALVLLTGIALVVSGLHFLPGDSMFSLKSSIAGSDAAPATPLETRPVSEIWPATTAKTLSRVNVEYRPTSNPTAFDTYCIYRYTDGSYVHQYIGQSNYPQQLTCE
jgi:hypothetical protein